MVMPLSELNGTSKQDYNFSSLSDSVVMVRVQQPYSKVVRQLLYNILGCFYILLTVQPNIMIVFFTNLMQKFFILIPL